MIMLGLLLGLGRHRRQHRPPTASPSAYRACRRHRLRRRSPWACSASPRSSANLGEAGTRASRRAGASQLSWPTREDFRRAWPADPARHRRSARSSASCPAAARCWPPSSPIRVEKKPVDASATSSARARSRASPAPEAANNAGAQTSFIPHAHARHPGQCRHGADGRRDDDPRHRSPARRSWPSSPTCSGA